jgi:hypothetical protein
MHWFSEKNLPNRFCQKENAENSEKLKITDRKVTFRA